MNKKKPILEKVYPGFGSSVLVKKHTEFLKTNKASWHFHPELELIYVNKANGKRHIGSHLSYFSNSQLILIGANLPHSGFTDRFTSNGKETVIQFKEDFLGENFVDLPEMQLVKSLFIKAKKGILFNIEVKKEDVKQLEEFLGFKTNWF